ncbi:MAG: hypothetical protein JXR94_10800, partial [Candidatus Hydrogenedentes bacterium]|nr:hypothetical protein [Candidatus Hydrogenedentota bacterium]
GIPPFKETRDYVRDVLAWNRTFSARGVDPMQYADVRPGPEQSPQTRITLHFHSGLSQPVDEVIVGDEHYDVRIKGRRFLVPKRLVREVEGAV